MSKNAVRRPARLVLLALLVFPARGVAAPAASAYELSWRVDAPLLATGVPMLTVSLLLPTCLCGGDALDPDLVPAIDSWCLCGYDRWCDHGSDHVQYTLLALPALFCLLEGWSHAVPLGVMFVEAFTLCMGIDGLLEKAVHRPRPYLYTGTAPPELLALDEGMESFPSGHTTSACASAAFVAFTFCRLHPDSPWRLPVVAGATLFAGAQAALRLHSGTHFLSDIVTGALLGTAAGILVPLAHERYVAVRPRVDGVEVAIPLP